MKDLSWFGEKSNREKNGVVNKVGKGIITVGVVVGAGILCGMGFHAFESAANSID